LVIVLSALFHLTIVLSVLFHLVIVLSVLFHLTIVLSVLFRFTAYDYTFGIFKHIFLKIKSAMPSYAMPCKLLYK
jgi:hypothetical protein